MGMTWFPLYFLLFIIIAGGANARMMRRRRQMGPRVQVDAAEFLRIVEREKGLVIKGRKVLWTPVTYVMRSGDYYYYTLTRDPLMIPAGVEVKEALSILL